jgi:flagellar hook-associated protein 3 FlgL
MGFRVSDATIFLNAVRYNRLNRYRLTHLQDQVGSGRRITSLADDPTDAARVLGLRRDAARLEQFGRGIDSARARLDPTESQLASLSDLLIRLKELAVQAGNYTTPEFDAERDKIRVEVEQRFDELFQLANARNGSGYLFSGYRTDLPAYTRGGDFTDGLVDAVNPTATYNGDANVLEIQIGEASRIEASVPGSAVFAGDFDGDGATDAGRVNLFDVVREFRNRLQDPTTGNPADMSGDLDLALSQVVETRGRIGATLNRLESTKAQILDLGLALETEREALEGVDVAEALTRLARYETTYQASLAVTARVIQPSLLDFLG